MLYFLLLLLLSGCGDVPDFLKYPVGSKLKNISVKSDQNPAKYTVVCDVVGVFDKDLAEKLVKLTSTEYFKSISTLHAVNSQNLSIWRIEHKPSTSNCIRLAWKDYSPKRVCAMILFCDYRGKGDHVKVLSKSTEQVDLVLGKKQITQVQESAQVTDRATLELLPSKDVQSLILVE